MRYLATSVFLIACSGSLPAASGGEDAGDDSAGAMDSAQMVLDASRATDAARDATLDAMTDATASAPDATVDASADASTDASTDADDYILVRKAYLWSLPTTGTAWNYLKARADEAVAITLDASSGDSPWLPNYERTAPLYLAAAFVYASSWNGDKQPYRDAVHAALRHVIGSEDSASTDGTSSGDALLATARSLGPFVFAADLIDFDPTTTGSRGGHTTVEFGDWLRAVLGKTIGTHGRWNTIVGTHENSATNQGARAGVTRVAIARYLDDQVELDRSVKVFRGFLGDAASYPAYPPGNKPAAGDGFEPSASFDSSWACPYAASVGGWRPINPTSCGGDYSGAVVDDISRSAEAFPNWDATGITYTVEVLNALVVTAIVLEVAGYDAFAWSDRALLRTMQWLDREGQVPTSTNFTCERGLPWIMNHFYGTSFPKQPASYCRAFGFADWLYP